MSDLDGLLARCRAAINEGAGQWVAGLLAFAVIAGAVGWWFIRDDGQSRVDAIRARGRHVFYFCKACGAGDEVHRKEFNPTFPFECPRCGKKEACIGFKCLGCRKIIWSNPAQVWRCPLCNYVYDNRMNPGDGPSGPPPAPPGRR